MTDGIFKATPEKIWDTDKFRRLTVTLDDGELMKAFRRHQNGEWVPELSQAIPPVYAKWIAESI